MAKYLLRRTRLFHGRRKRRVDGNDSRAFLPDKSLDLLIRKSEQYFIVQSKFPPFNREEYHRSLGEHSEPDSTTEHNQGGATILVVNLDVPREPLRWQGM